MSAGKTPRSARIKAEEARRHEGGVPSVSYPRGARKTARMLRRLGETGFVSFLE